MSDFDLGDVRIYNTVSVRNEFGRFAQHCEEADRKSVEEAADVGAQVARMAAPRKTGLTASTIRSTGAIGSFASGIRGSVRARIEVGGPHWQYTEMGARPHDITGNVSFFWDKAGRRWLPGRNTIRHPGTRAVHYMERGFEAARDELTRAMRRNY